ncbi:Na(+)/H(+) antiporter NhaA 2 [Sphaerisporangium krabiense]|uniref:Na(+)/H(+) antiporter NhaA n=1 Tax=Sphaerisporangium krabiense TaxID=763782 RepID=A0A7W8Z0W5_9ACTN|nr:Na+/H+ antiporter NhaA [Sphaerisporangium krabiense]MBB5625428.1 Na+/H+ antiporter NhaA [Sphaerisporangium krabiense]GII64058.1 Na(+)/H(+) antiporter NhaA 2 [Sphaerisporangium krabiense]
MTEFRQGGRPLSGRTTWGWRFDTPLREFLRTETGSAAILLAATVAALGWANLAPRSYEAIWGTHLSVSVGDAGVALDLRHWVNAGLMTFFFFVVGLEARREFDMGELRDRRRLLLPVVAGVGGMLVPIVVYLLFNGGRPSAYGWGAAMSTDTAFALGMLALVASRLPTRARTYMLTVTVVDDLVALAAITLFYSRDVSWPGLVAAVAIFGLTLLVKAARLRSGLIYVLLGAAAWVALLKSGVEPVVIGLAMGLLTYASPAARSDLERASDLFRLFREQPTAELARSASLGVAKAISPNHRLLQLYHPWTGYVIVPMFALANAGIPISGAFVERALRSPITLGIFFAYVLGKPVGIAGATWLVTRLSGGRVRAPVGWAALVSGGTIAGIGFTVSLLIATLAFEGPQLEEAKFGVLAAALAASVLTWLVSRLTALLPRPVKIRALLGTAEPIVDLAAPVDPYRDHMRGPEDAPVTLVEYGDFECPYCGQAEPIVRELLAGFGELRYVWRHLPLQDVHPSAQLAAEAAEAAAEQGAFWEMHDILLDHQGALLVTDLLAYAERIGLDVQRFHEDLEAHAGAERIAEDVDSADLSGVSGTPTFFVNGRRHEGAYDVATLSAAVRTAKARVYASRS